MSLPQGKRNPQKLHEWKTPDSKERKKKKRKRNKEQFLSFLLSSFICSYSPGGNVTHSGDDFHHVIQAGRGYTAARKGTRQGPATATGRGTGREKMAA